MTSLRASGLRSRIEIRLPANNNHYVNHFTVKSGNTYALITGASSAAEVM
jgi:hypothetical protein